MPGPRLRHLLCLILLLPLLAGGGGALAGVVEDWCPVADQTTKVHPAKTGGCCGNMSSGRAAAMASGGCCCPVDAPCRVQATPVHHGLSALLAAPVWPDAPAPALTAVSEISAQPTPHAAAPRRNPDPPPQARYLRLAVLRI